MPESSESIKRQLVYERNYRRARERALVRLSRVYPDLYRQLLNEERRKDEQEGKAWVDYDLDSGIPIRAGSQDQRGDASIGQADGDESTPRNLGAEA